MRTLTHRFFAAHLASYLSVHPLCRAAFRLGCVEPDLNVLTHLSRSAETAKVPLYSTAGTGASADEMLPMEGIVPAARKWRCNGHDLPVIDKKIARLFHKLTLFPGQKRGMLFFFRLGVLIHYLTDAFTFAHNPTFGGDLSDHVEYEDRFHDYFVERFQAERTPTACLGQTATFDFAALHAEYRAEPCAFATDYDYIQAATLSVLSALHVL